jgi:hypothetical protein
MWSLGYPEAALADADRAIKDAREIGQAVTLMIALSLAVWPAAFCGDYAAASSLVDEYLDVAYQKDAAYWKAMGTLVQGAVLALKGNAPVAVQTISFGLNASRSTGRYIFRGICHIWRRPTQTSAGSTTLGAVSMKPSVR